MQSHGSHLPTQGTITPKNPTILATENIFSMPFLWLTWRSVGEQDFDMVSLLPTSALVRALSVALSTLHVVKGAKGNEQRPTQRVMMCRS